MASKFDRNHGFSRLSCASEILNDVQFTSVFVTVLQTQVLLGVVTGAAFFLILYGNVTLARRLAPREAL